MVEVRSDLDLTTYLVDAERVTRVPALHEHRRDQLLSMVDSINGAVPDPDSVSPDGRWAVRLGPDGLAPFAVRLADGHRVALPWPETGRRHAIAAHWLDPRRVILTAARDARALHVDALAAGDAAAWTDVRWHPEHDAGPPEDTLDDELFDRLGLPDRVVAHPRGLVVARQHPDVDAGGTSVVFVPINGLVPSRPQLLFRADDTGDEHEAYVTALTRLDDGTLAIATHDWTPEPGEPDSLVWRVALPPTGTSRAPELAARTPWCGPDAHSRSEPCLPGQFAAGTDALIFASWGHPTVMDHTDALGRIQRRAMAPGDPNAFAENTHTLTLSPDGRVLLAVTTEGLRAWDFRTGDLRWQRTIGHLPEGSEHGPPRHARFVDHGPTVVVDDGTDLVWLRRGQEIRRVALHRPLTTDGSLVPEAEDSDLSVASVKVLPDGRLLATVVRSTPRFDDHDIRFQMAPPTKLPAPTPDSKAQAPRPPVGTLTAGLDSLRSDSSSLAALSPPLAPSPSTALVPSPSTRADRRFDVVQLLPAPATAQPPPGERVLGAALRDLPHGLLGPAPPTPPAD